MKALKSLVATGILAGVLLAKAGIADAVRVDAIAPAPVAGVIDAWVYVDYPMSVSCEGHGCYAKSQWIFARVHCVAGFWLPMSRISLDLNGNVVAVAHADAAARFVRARDPGAAAVFYQLCGGVPE